MSTLTRLRYSSKRTYWAEKECQEIQSHKQTFLIAGLSPRRLIGKVTSTCPISKKFISEIARKFINSILFFSQKNRFYDALFSVNQRKCHLHVTL